MCIALKFLANLPLIVGLSVRTRSSIFFLSPRLSLRCCCLCVLTISRLLFVLHFRWLFVGGVVVAVLCVKDERVFVGHHAIDEANKRTADREVRQQSAYTPFSRHFFGTLL